MGCFLLLILPLLLSPSLAGQGKGQHRGKSKRWEEGYPPGWERGEKKGWQGGETPPGLQKKGKLPPGLAKKCPPGWKSWPKERRETWKEERQDAVRRILKRAGVIDPKSVEGRWTCYALEKPSTEGIPIKVSEKVVGKAIDKGYKGEELGKIGDALSLGAGKVKDYKNLGEFVNHRLDEGVKGEKLAREVKRYVEKREREIGR